MKQQGKLEYKIYIDTSIRDNESVRLVLFKDGNETIIGEKKGKIDTTKSIKELLKENKLKLSDISLFYPNLGPGSFTGLKVGVTIANILNYFIGKKSLTEMQLPEYGREPNITKPKDSNRV